MYRSKQFYNYYRDIIIDIYLDYGIKTFPIKAKELCRKMGIVLVPYSILKGEEFELAFKKSYEGFYVPKTKDTPPMIYYNDDEEMMTNGRIRYTIFHEIKHYVCDDKEETEESEDAAKYFAKYIMCPIPYLVYNQKYYTGYEKIQKRFNTSLEVAQYLYDQLKRRIARSGNALYEKEVILIDAIYDREFDVANYEVILKEE